MTTREEIFRRFDVNQPWRPLYTVWELTLRCDQHCTHCGSRAGQARAEELSTEEALQVVAQLRQLGCFECVLIGGEAYLYPGFFDVVKALSASGIRTSMTTGGRGITAEMAQQLADCGMHTVSVSIDGLEATHDLMRATKGSFRTAIQAIQHLQHAGIRTASNINLNRLNETELESVYELLRDTGITAWQVQLTVPLGRAADRPHMMLQPWDLLSLMPRIATLKRRAFEEARMVLQPGNNLGFFGPEEALLRSPTPGMKDFFQGCQAGRHVLGIEANGDVKGCPSLQSKPYVGGNLKHQSLEALWNGAPKLHFTRSRTVGDLHGFCGTCPFAQKCLGGCSFTAHALTGRAGNNPYCHYRARDFANRGLRERLVPRHRAPGEPFDSASFEIVIEALDARDSRPPSPAALMRTWNGGAAGA